MLPFPATQPKNLMVSAGARSKDYDKSRYISILNIIQARAAAACASAAVLLQCVQVRTVALGEDESRTTFPSFASCRRAVVYSCLFA